MLTKEHPLYKVFEMALEIRDSMSSAPNPFILTCIGIAERHADQQTASLQSEIERLRKENEWVSCNDRQPDIGDEYNVAWDLEDGQNLVVTTMEWDSIHKKWFDIRGANIDVTKSVKFWRPLPAGPEEGK